METDSAQSLLVPLLDGIPETGEIPILEPVISNFLQTFETNSEHLHTIFLLQQSIAAQKKEIQLRFPNQSTPIIDKTDFVCLQEHPNTMPIISRVDIKHKQQMRHQFKSQLQLNWDNDLKGYEYMPNYSKRIHDVL